MPQELQSRGLGTQFETPQEKDVPAVQNAAGGVSNTSLCFVNARRHPKGRGRPCGGCNTTPISHPWNDPGCNRRSIRVLASAEQQLANLLAPATRSHDGAKTKKVMTSATPVRTPRTYLVGVGVNVLRQDLKPMVRDGP